MSNPWIKQLPEKIRDITPQDYNQYKACVLFGQFGDWVTVPDGAVWGGLDTLIPATGVVVVGKGHARIDAYHNLYNTDSYLLNLHLPGKQSMAADDTGFINNVIEGDGTLGYAGLLSTGGKDQVTYGNIIRHCQHGLYIQNKSTDGIEYVVQNYIGDCIPSDNSRSIHAYTQQPDNLYRMQFIQNVVNGNQALLGGEVGSTTPLYNLFQENWFNLADLLLGYKRAECTDLLSNKLYNSILLREHFMGDDMVSDDWGICTGNDFYNDGAAHGWDHIRFATHPDGTAGIRSVEQWDNNMYWGVDYMRSPFHAGGVQTYCRGLDEWRTATRNAGKEFDTNSIFTIGPPPDQYWLIPNDYDPDRAMLVVWGQNSVTLPRPATLWNVFDSVGNDITPITNPFPIGTPLNLSTWIVKYQTTPSICNLPEARRLLNEAYAKSNQKGVKTRIKSALANMEGC